MHKLRLLSLPILLATFTFSEALSQDSPGPGFLKIVNLVALETPSFIRLGKFKLNGGTPSIPGSETGFMAIRPGDYTLTVTNEGGRPDEESLPIKIETGKNVIIICFDDTKINEEGEPRSKLRFNTLTESLSSDLPRLTVVSLLEADQVIGKVGGDQVMFQKRKAMRRPVNMYDNTTIQVAGELVEEVSIMREAHYIVFLFRDPETKEVATSVVMNSEFDFTSLKGDGVASVDGETN